MGVGEKGTRVIPSERYRAQDVGERRLVHSPFLLWKCSQFWGATGQGLAPPPLSEMQLVLRCNGAEITPLPQL